MRITEIYFAFRDHLREKRLEIAANRLDELLRITPRYWTAAAIGGQVNLELGKVTHKEALRLAREAGHEIAYVDLKASFIALQGDPSANNL